MGRQNLRYLRQQDFIQLVERAGFVGVGIDLPDDLTAAADEHDDLRTRRRGAGQVIRELANVNDDLICPLGDSRSADSLSNCNPEVFRGAPTYGPSTNWSPSSQ